MKGIDVSNNNGSINFSNVKSSGIECVYVKATEGTTFVDKYKNTFYNLAKQSGLYVGFYHFLVATSSPETQAENFFNEIKNYKNDLVPMLDVERNFTNLNDYMYRFINKFISLSNMEIGIYSYTSFIKNYISSKFKDYKLWEANYNDSPWNLPNNFFNVRIGHQYSESARVNGVNGICDINDFNLGVFINNSSPVSPISYSNENECLTLQRELNVQGFKDKNGNKLVEDGIPGPLTLSACPVVKKGARGNITTWIQLRCGANPDGIFGNDTENAVKWMQRKWNINDDGIVGIMTWTKLLGL
ncbi:GH25 family lysozyme [Clostridium sp. HCP1S3_A12]|nr:GH25 family lysozyme [Clostridiales bacterium]MDY2728908.1 GH25 family lysozyme [Clostridium sp.]